MRVRPMLLAATFICAAGLASTAAAVPADGHRQPLVVDAVVSNVDASLALEDRVDDGEPALAVNPRQPNQIAMLTGRALEDSGENWFPQGCQANAETCPAVEHGNAFGSIWLSDDGGKSWAK